MLRLHSAASGGCAVRGQLMLEVARHALEAEVPGAVSGVETGDMPDPDGDLVGLLAFRRLDLLLTAGGEGRHTHEAAGDSHRGLDVSEEQVRRPLHAPSAMPLMATRPV